MDGTQFDTLSRRLARALSRRRLGEFGVGVALASLLPHSSVAKTASQRLKKGKGKGKKKHRNTPLVLNQFGCVDVGGHCKGNSANCCSGVCQGSVPKRGKPDRSICVSHNQDGCTPATSVCNLGPSPAAQCNPAINPQALCFATTGNAGFCGNTIGFVAPTSCRPCAKDADCVALGFPPGSACVLLTGGICAPACPTTGNRTCFPPGI